MTELNRTVLYERHLAAGAQMVEFGGWEMPIHYPEGIVHEHLATRRSAGLFDVSHMGRFLLRGRDTVPFLQHVLTNNAAALEVNEGQYTMLPNAQGGALDDAYLYRFFETEYLLVVNAANREEDWRHLQSARTAFDEVEIEDATRSLAMLSLQGASSRQILSGLLESGMLPEPLRNYLSIAAIAGADAWIARTGYTGDPLGFELFVPQTHAVAIWDALLQAGASPVGLGARDTLRLEAGLPLYGHELGTDPEGNEIPIFACPLARFAVSLSPLKGEFIGRQPLQRQFEAYRRILDRDYTRIADLPRLIMPLAMLDKGVARAGHPLFRNGKAAGFITSGTMVPYWQFDGDGIASRIGDTPRRRAIALALLDSDLCDGDTVSVQIRGRQLRARIVPYHLRNEAPPLARPIPCDRIRPPLPEIPPAPDFRPVKDLLRKSLNNTRWRQRQCVNLIPSEQTASPMVRRLSIMDPAFRYAEHKPVKAFGEAEVFYYQGTDFISEVEKLATAEMRRFLGCRLVETRPVAGQMANTAVFSALVDFFNRADRKSEQRRIRQILNHHIIKGGHLSAQPLGALRDFVARDPRREKPAVINFPVRTDDPYQVDLEACRTILAEYRPELIIFGRSMTLYKEPVAAVRSMVRELGLDCLLMYDMAHVLGLAGPHFQEPFKEGADLVTASTHKTFFGPQRGVIAADWTETELGYTLWEAIQRRAFPGSVSNHHLGTLLGLLMAAYEMNHFKEDYQRQVLANARAFACALSDCGLDVAGDPAIGHTETHQVIVAVGYARGPAIARRLEANNIIVNYQATAFEEGFTAAGALRMGVSEMTRFGMREPDFQQLAQLLADVVIRNRHVKEEVTQLRGRFTRLHYCFEGAEFEELMEGLHRML
jgi:aminomethyltransferase